MRRTLLSSFVLCAAVAGVSGTAAPTARALPRQPPPAKVVRACNVAAIPMTVGNSWTYAAGPPPEDRQVSEAQQKGMPLQPVTITIKVDKIDVVGGVTTVTLSEDLDGRVHTSTVTCTAGGQFQLSPNAFWWNGEPGNTFGIDLTNVVRKGNTIDLIGGKFSGATEWHDDLHANWQHVALSKRQPPLRKGTLEVNRHVVVQPAEEVDAGAAGKWKANKLGIESTIKVTVDPAPEKPLRDPPLVVNFLYQVDGVGIVQAINSYGRTYRLSKFTVQ